MRKNINIQVYSSCNCNCNFCHFKDTLGLKINPAFVIDYLNSNPDYNYIVLTGGEPTFAIEECAQIINSIDKSFKTVVLQSNGWWGENERVKQVLLQNPPSVVQLSVDTEKQKAIPITSVAHAFDFLKSNNIEVKVVNHTMNNAEYEEYKKTFPELIKGYIAVDDGNLFDCGTALLATNEESNLNIKGWGGVQNG